MVAARYRVTHRPQASEKRSMVMVPARKSARILGQVQSLRRHPVEDAPLMGMRLKLDR